MMAVVGVLTKRSGELVQFKHDVHSVESCQGSKENLQILAHSLKKLQNDVNSCLTEIIEKEKTSTPASQKRKLVWLIKLKLVCITLLKFVESQSID